MHPDSLTLSGIVVSAFAIQSILKSLMHQQPDNILLAEACLLAEQIDEEADELLLSRGGV
jgi:hypothetical protein